MTALTRREDWLDSMSESGCSCWPLLTSVLLRPLRAFGGGAGVSVIMVMSCWSFEDDMLMADARRFKVLGCSISAGLLESGVFDFRGRPGRRFVVGGAMADCEFVACVSG